MPALVWVWTGEGGTWPRRGTAFPGPQGSRPTSRGPREAPTALQPRSPAAPRPALQRRATPLHPAVAEGTPSACLAREAPPPELTILSRGLGGATPGARDRSLQLGFSLPSSGGITPRPRPTQCRQQRSRGGVAGSRRACAVSSGARRPGAGSPRAAPPRAR